MAEFRGLAEFLVAVKAVRDKGFLAVREVSRAQARALWSQSQANCPIDTGELKASGKVRNTPTGAQVIYSAPHAFIVHENLKMTHETGRAKYLEAPLRMMIYPTGDAWFAAYRKVIEAAGE